MATDKKRKAGGEASVVQHDPRAEAVETQEAAPDAAGAGDPIALPLTGFPVVGIGASAGGLGAFEAFFSGMPNDTDPGMAFVLVQHLAPDHKSILTDLIRRYTRMQVFEVEDGMVVQANCAYIIPPNCDMALRDGTLYLTEPSAPRGLRLPIDFFFRSLARDQGERAIGIVLSGTGSDGTLGVRAIKGEGGMVMAQSLDSTDHDGMPRNAVATGLVDFQLAPAEMPAQLIAYAAHAFNRPSRLAAAPASKVESAIAKILALLRSRTGHDFSLYKESTIRRRIGRRMSVHQTKTLEDYIKFLERTPTELETLFRDFLIGVTSFFRDPEAFQELEKRVISDLIAKKSPGEAIRVWTPGCSTGEEAYSIAILLLERQEATQLTFKVNIFATDIDSQAIATARAGVYPSAIAADVSQDRLRRYFTQSPDGSAYRIQKGVRDMLVFSEQDLTRDPPFSKLDLIACRNLLIYMGTELHERIIPLFHRALNPGGFLFLGTSETVGKFADSFTPLNRRFRLYQRTEATSDAQRAALGHFLPHIMVPEAAPPQAAGRIAGPRRPPLRELAEQALLQRFAPSGALVNGHGEIRYVHGRTGMYLEPSPGDAGVNNILKMAREGLRRDLTTALHKAASTKAIIRQPGMQVRTNGDFRTINVTVCPVGPGSAAAAEEPLFLVVFEDAGTTDAPPPSRPERGPGETDTGAEARIAALERELQAKEEYLQTATEQLETFNEELKSSNEEMQSVNEELQSTNEELETSKEELQSVNEELSTVNAELHAKVTSLSRANNDMNNLLAGTGIATIFVDHQLRILRFTSAATGIINLIESDTGRPVGDIVSKVAGYDRLVEDAQEVLNSLIPKEVDVRTTDGKWYSLRIMPYRTLDNVIEGAVITFVDISEVRHAEQRLEIVNDRLDQKNRELESIIYVASHDLWSPLVNIKGFSDKLDRVCASMRSLVEESRPVEDLKKELGTALDSASQALEFIGAGVTQMDRLLSGLLRLSRLGQAALRLEPLDVNAILADIARAFEFQVREKGATLEIESLPSCFGDAVQVNQIFSNLLDNALKYLDPKRPGVIRVSGTTDRRWTTYRVEDNGIGIAPKDQDRVFEVFHRVHPDGPAAGEGLGLATVRRALDRQRGTIRLESEPGKGSRFFVVLPSEAE